ncbi:KEOPS complex subunit Cgi121 [Nitrosopumilus sp.]|uniref:KEOPS complex subunit Cgi121 n=1 Tax=Nitrosopumilus sp. TaxID=2024843 RepID=UPI0026200F27|nr:KEOPS complex subunit Cgi121 [Nitrosopumilus sp.]
MITVKFVGGAKKSFQTDQLELEKSEISIESLLLELENLQPENSPKLDSENSLIAINGVDSSAIDGKKSIIKNNDIVSIIPVIHGGSSNKLIFESQKKLVQALEIKGSKKIDIKFIDELRKKYPKLKIQAISSSFILNNYHLKRIVSLSMNSEKNNVLLSKKLETDLLMRFAITKQISDAIKTAGLKSNKNFILISIGNKTMLNSLYADLSENLIPLFSKNNQSFIKKYFKINQKYVNSVNSKTPLEDILIEKAAVLL